MEDPLLFWIDLTFDSSAAAPKTRVLDRYSGRCEFDFTNHETGAKFHRVPYDTGMLIMPVSEDLIALSNHEPARVGHLLVYMLSEKGEQIPAGTYSVQARYANDGGTWWQRDSTLALRFKDLFDGGWDLWRGQITSSPWTLVIRPAVPESIDIQVPTMIRIDSKSRAPQIAWGFSGEGMQRIRVLKSPGTALGNRWRLHQIFKGQDKSYMHAIGGAPVGSGTRGGNPPDLWSTDGWCFLSPGDSKDLLSDPASQLVLDLEIFESSSQPQHMWQPEKGDLRVLWTGQLHKTLSAP